MAQCSSVEKAAVEGIALEPLPGGVLASSEVAAAMPARLLEPLEQVGEENSRLITKAGLASLLAQHASR